MKRNLKILSLFITLSLFSCSKESQIDSNAVLNSDFPVSGKLKFKPFNTYDIPKQGGYVIDGPTLWYFLHSNTERDNGYCYDLKTGAKLSTISHKVEIVIPNVLRTFLSAPSFTPKIIGDSIQLYPDNSTINTFAKKDIIENKPMNERKFSVTTAPDSIDVGQMIKLTNGSVIATISNRTEKQEKSSLNNKSVVVFNEDSANFHETINYDSYDMKSVEPEKDPKDIIKYAYNKGYRELKDDNMAVFSVDRQFILYTLDINSGKVVKERRYTKMQHREASMTQNDLKMGITYLKANDKYIFCVVNGYFSKKDKESERRTYKLFIFDWDLNPIKRFDLPYEKNQEYIISNDGRSIYIGKHKNNVLTLSKADIDT